MRSPRFRRIAGFIAIALIAGGLAHAVGGETRWDTASAASYSRKHGGTALLIYRNGKLMLEEYSKGVSRGSTLPGFSITKSLVAMACLATPEIRLSDQAGPKNAIPGVTVRHLLSQTSGIATGYNRLYAPGLKDVRKSAATLKCDAAPGTQFAYGPSHYELLASVPGFDKPSGRNSLRIFLEKAGINPAGWRTDRSGNLFLSAGAFLSPQELLKAGRFVLDRGRARGFTPLIPPSKFREALQGTNANPCYGLGFWLNQTAGAHARERDIEEAIHSGLSKSEWHSTCISKNAPTDLVCMAGTGGQRVYVIPSLRTVIVRTGLPGKFRDPDFLNALFSRRDG